MSLSVLEDPLENGHSHPLGDEASYADFSLYNPAWFLSAYPPNGRLVAAFPHGTAWRDRMAGSGYV
jgi:glutathione S-transferase